MQNQRWDLLVEGEIKTIVYGSEALGLNIKGRLKEMKFFHQGKKTDNVFISCDSC